MPLLTQLIAEIQLETYLVLSWLYAYRLTNQMPEQKLLLQLLGEAHKSKQLPLLQASSTIPLTLPDRNQNKAARSGGGREAWGQVENYAPASDWSGSRSRANEGPCTSLIVSLIGSLFRTTMKLPLLSPSTLLSTLCTCFPDLP